MTKLLMPLSPRTKFLFGTNIPWIRFAEDAVDFPEESERLMMRAMNDVKSAGGNAIRWWLHTNGRLSPTVNSGKVSGLHKNTIPIVKKVLDMALERELVVCLCLWSFDMLQNQGQDVAAMKNLLEKVSHTNYYIENALIPLVSELGANPAIMTWELFNEPEGMVEELGWTASRTNMRSIQRTVNLMASAIHQYARGVPVSNGSWNISVLSDINNFHNFYRDDRLIGAGNKCDGYLDLYQVHFYPENFGINYSPFHNHAKVWKLDKPLLIGEFPNSGCSFGKILPNKNAAESFEYALTNGYAGCLSWRWPEEAGLGSFIKDAKPAIESTRKKIDK